MMEDGELMGPLAVDDAGDAGVRRSDDVLSQGDVKSALNALNAATVRRVARASGVGVTFLSERSKADTIAILASELDGWATRTALDRWIASSVRHPPRQVTKP